MELWLLQTFWVSWEPFQVHHQKEALDSFEKKLSDHHHVTGGGKNSSRKIYNFREVGSAGHRGMRITRNMLADNDT